MSLPNRNRKLWSDRSAQLAPVRDSSSWSHDAGHDTVHKLGVALQGLSASGDVMILSYAHSNNGEPNVVFASGFFSEIAKRRLSPSFAALHRSAGVESGAVLIFDTGDVNRADLGLPTHLKGTVAVFAVDMGLDGTYSVLVFLPAEAGPLGKRHVQAFQALAQLAAGAAVGNDPVPAEKLESQVRIEVLEHGLREAETFYRLLQHSIRQCYWVLDMSSHRVSTVSENFEDVWGASRSILTEHGMTGFMANVDAEDRDRVLSRFHTSLGRNFDDEFRVLSPDGERRWVWLRVSPIEGDMGDVSKLVFIADDVTDRKAEEERVRTKEAELITRARALAVVDLASGVAHEINNPLTVIVGKCAEIVRKLDKGSTDPQEIKEAIERIQATSIRISEIVKSLKSLSRQDRGEVLSSATLVNVAREVADLANERFKVGGVKLDIEMPVESMRAEMNATLVAQLILNLLSNGFDAVQDQPEKWVRLEFSEDEDSVYVAVTDSGCGIPIKNRSRIFDPFFTTKGPGKGTGLGLSLATSIAAHHQGCLRLDTFSKNTRFVLQLPKINSPARDLRRGAR